jgi:cytochrome c-type biogenesis protein CcmH/NrfG
MATGKPAEPTPRPPRRPKFRVVAAALALLGCAAFATWMWLPRRPQPDTAPDDPRLTFATPFRNVRPGVGYVGDAVCARCHQEVARTYRRHPMGRSFAPVAQVAREERYDGPVHNPFEKFGLHFLVERRGERVFHKESRLGPGGRALTEVEAEVGYSVGSGTRGRSYLVNRDGYLFQSPISWFSQAGTWDLSPGFGAGQHFDRPIEAQCLFCHANGADPVEHTINRYRTTAGGTDLQAIGCERCHGPGELHVGQHKRGAAVSGADDTIVNPRRLEPALREAVCEQCHLEGELRILRRNRGPFDYRPGLPLHLFWSVFVRLPELTDNRHAVSQVEQMTASHCFRASGGKLGCVSCHDPHDLPAPAQKTAYYRDRCLECHGGKGCQLPPVARQKNGDDCRACHMPRLHSSDIVHTAVTDHRILRQLAPAGEEEPPAAPRSLDPGEVPIVSYYRDRVAPRDKEVTRDLGLALVQLARQHGPSARPLGRLALPLLEGAVHRDGADVAALEAKGYALWMEGQPAEALETLEAALAKAPGRERSLDDAASLAVGLKRHDDALAYSRRAVEVNPWVPSYHLRLGQLLAEDQDWEGALGEAQAVLRLDPGSVPARTLLVRCYIRTTRRERARAEFAALLALEPPDREALQRWFAEEMR